MRQLIDFLPIAVFFVVYWMAGRDFYLATAALMAATVAQVGLVYALTGRVDRQLRITFWLVLGLGGLTLALQQKAFVMWKPTVINWIFAVALAGSQYIGRRNLLERMLGHQLHLPDYVWRNLTWGWSGAFFLAGALNLVVAYGFSEAFWVNYKLFGGFGLTLVYVIATVVYLVRGGHLSEPPPSAEEARPRSLDSDPTGR